MAGDCEQSAKDEPRLSLLFSSAFCLIISELLGGLFLWEKKEKQKEVYKTPKQNPFR